MDLESRSFEAIKLEGADLLDYLKLNSGLVLKSDEIAYFLESPINEYAQVIFHLSETNKIIFWQTFRKTYIFENYCNFNEEEMYFLCEAMKNQVQNGHDDFFYIMHHFFKNIGASWPLQRLFIYLSSTMCFKLREFIITENLVEKVLKNKNTPDIFKIKLIKAVTDAKSLALNEYLCDKKLKLEMKQPRGCLAFFKKWYRKSNLIKIKFNQDYV